MSSTGCKRTTSRRQQQLYQAFQNRQTASLADLSAYQLPRIEQSSQFPYRTIELVFQQQCRRFPSTLTAPSTQPRPPERLPRQQHQRRSRTHLLTRALRRPQQSRVLLGPKPPPQDTQQRSQELSQPSRPQLALRSDITHLSSRPQLNHSQGPRAHRRLSPGQFQCRPEQAAHHPG